MLLWEVLAAKRQAKIKAEPVSAEPERHSQRLPFDTRCSAMTKSGKRCQGRILKGREFCFCHDPECVAKRQARRMSEAELKRRRLMHLPGGYLRKLSNRRTIGNAMDRIYREVRLGEITPEMGRVLFLILTRILDSGLADGASPPRLPGRTRAERLRPRLDELLTRAERSAWRKAVAGAPELFADSRPALPIIDAVVEESASPRRLPDVSPTVTHSASRAVTVQRITPVPIPAT